VGLACPCDEPALSRSIRVSTTGVVNRLNDASYILWVFYCSYSPCIITQVEQPVIIAAHKRSLSLFTVLSDLIVLTVLQFFRSLILTFKS
jgi:hypothetical protein